MEVSFVRDPLKQCKITCVVNTPTVLLFITAEGSQNAVAAEPHPAGDVIASRRAAAAVALH